jgi:hypothetical protein
MRIILCFLLALVAAPVWAEWVRVTEDHDAVGYIDPATIRSDGHFRKVWEVSDLKKRDAFGGMSHRVLYEYDCKEGRYRIHSLSALAGPMASGEILLTSNTQSDWDYIPPGTPGVTVLKFVCSR